MLKPWLSPSFADFSTACLQGRLPGSVIIAGSSGSGCMELALECARFYLCEHQEGGRPCGSCASCRSFAAGAHPDFIMLRSSLKEEADAGLDLVTNPALALSDPELQVTDSGNRRSVRIDSIRKLIDWIGLSPAYGRGKACIINDAHTMPEGAANSILKSFEEPPPHTLIIMTAKSLESLLPTIISRAYKITLKEASLNVAEGYLGGMGFSGRASMVGLALARQDPDKAVQLLQEGIDKKAQRIISLLCTAVQGGADGELIDELAALAPAIQVMILGELVRELLKYKAGFALATLPLLDEQSAALLVRLPAEHLFTALSSLDQFAVSASYIPPRAPLALLRSWVQALAKGGHK